MPIPPPSERPDLYDYPDCRPDFDKPDPQRDAFIQKLLARMKADGVEITDFVAKRDAEKK